MYASYVVGKGPVTEKHIPTSTIRTNLKLDISKYSGINNLLKMNCQAQSGLLSFKLLMCKAG